MISLDEINSEITKLESQQTTYAVIERLSWLYTVRDHMTIDSAEIPRGESEYRKVCCSKSIECVMSTMDELMDTLLIIQPRLYHAVIEKLTLN